MVPSPSPPQDKAVAKAVNGVGARTAPKSSPPAGIRQPPAMLDKGDLYSILYRKYNSS